MSQDDNRNSLINAIARTKVVHALAKDVAQFSPKVFKHLQRGGIRKGAGRTTTEIQQLLDKIPPSQKAGIDQQSAVQNIKSYLSNKDASHLKSHNNGGSGNPDNIVWENRSLNRARGDRDMTVQEHRGLKIQAQAENLTGAIKAGLQAAPKGALVGAITTLPLSTLRNGLRVVRGEISAMEAAQEAGKETAMGAGVGAATALTVTSVATACPPIAIVLTTISPALLVVGGIGLSYEFFKILENHKQKVKTYYESMTEQELAYLDHLEAELTYEHEKALAKLKQQEELTKQIVKRPRGKGVGGALKRYIESQQILQSLQEQSNKAQSFEATQQDLLPPS